MRIADWWILLSRVYTNNFEVEYKLCGVYQEFLIHRPNAILCG